MKKIDLKCCVHFLNMLVILCCIGTISVIAQTDSTRLGVDDLFSIAREKAFNKHHEDARTILRLILLRSPSYHDVRILLGRTYAWDRKYDSAKIEIQRVIAEDPSSQDAFNALIDVFLWSEKDTDALETADKALKTYPSNEDFLMKKARALKNIGRDQEALNVLNMLEDVHPSTPGITAMRQEISIKTMDNSVGVNYAIDAFRRKRTDAIHVYSGTAVVHHTARLLSG